ncbi:MAG: hypothetical protein GXO89_01450 [Chlorobi bacterium]|nr:hypothetical protein [Chlorobiota bacterium]
MKQKTHRIFSIIIGILFPIITFSQGSFKSYIYNDNGQLRIDTTLKINQDQFKIWHLSENNILAIISNNIKFSNLAKEAGIAGIAIVAFDCDTSDLSNIRLINKLGGGLDESIIEGIEKMGERVVLEFRLIQNLKRRDRISYLGTYYIPIEFSLIDLREEMKTKNTIPVIDSKTLLLDRWIE